MLEQSSAWQSIIFRNKEGCKNKETALKMPAELRGSSRKWLQRILENEMQDEEQMQAGLKDQVTSAGEACDARRPGFHTPPGNRYSVGF